MKVSVIISMCDNRLEMFRRSLDTWVRQTESDFELIIVDDAKRDDILELCLEYESLNFQYIRINNSLCDVPITTFTPVLSNNVGFRMARGEVVCITGPETLQSKNNIKIAATFKNRTNCGYGLVFKSNKSFVETISKKWDRSFDNLFKIPGSRAECLSRPPHPPAYNYFMVVAKKYVNLIHGLDELFGQGYCGEDDDFSNRMRMMGIIPIFEQEILGIHQDHSSENTEEHKLRFSKQELKQRNLKIMKGNLKNKNVIVNINHTWGDPKVITRHCTF
jgi:glycosyltransferase involved in cell wall biosynthesis